MTEKRSDEYVSNIRLSCIIDSPEEIEQMRYFFSEEDISRITNGPDFDGKYRFIVEMIRINTSPTNNGEWCHDKRPAN